MRLEELESGLRVDGVIPNEAVTVLYAQRHGADAVELTYKTAAGGLGQQVVFRDDEDGLRLAQSGSRAFDADPRDFKLAAEAQRITFAGLSDPMLAVATSDVQPLPHQIRAVYGELLPRTPLRFLLADDPGAGKTIMAGLYIKELLLRDDVRRCLIIAPGGLVDQWQDELLFKFGLRFDILTNQAIEANAHFNVFENFSLLIARMDQLSRNELLQAQLRESEWDLIVVDEAHRMGAHYFGGELRKTKRFQLGEMLGGITRHLLLMTATPHSGKEEDFQLFLTLLDPDRFQGKRTASADMTGIMSRMVKEDLLTFEGKRLFPERIAQTVPYQLSPLERDLYEDVTQYVREGMNRAQRLGGQRKNTVGFALTVLQRRLASSPEAIFKSLVRRAHRLEQRKHDIQNGTYRGGDVVVDPSMFDEEELTTAQLEQLEEDLMDSATAAQTVEELDAELVELAGLIRTARLVRDAGTDRKWTELSRILQDNAVVTDGHGRPRKMIVFTEHRDTLEYLRGRIGAFLQRPSAVRTIHGGVSRVERRQITEEFTTDPHCQILLATDAAGEGLNLQAAHLMVNYDLPWNPNRIEQRFGRIHRIGQEEVCRLWNLVASDTREGEVFTRLLEKLDQMRQTYGGKVFDVLGEAFSERPLRDLLLDAIQYGEQPEVKAKMHEIIDATVGDGLAELINDRALATDTLSERDVITLRVAMDSARVRRLQPHYIELAFRTAFTRFGGRITRREKGRFEVANVPQRVRSSAVGPVATNYSRVTFDLAQVQGPAAARADLLAPGHPLHDAVMGQTLAMFGAALNHGTTLVSASLDQPRLMVGIVEEVVDATGESVARRFGYAYVDHFGAVTPAGPAPYLDFAAAPACAAVDTARRMSWLVDAESRAISWIISNRLPVFLSEVRPLRAAELEKARAVVIDRLGGERERLTTAAAIAAEKERGAEKPKESSESLRRKAADIDARLATRINLIDKQLSMSTKPPRIVTAALVLPLGMVAGELDRHVPITVAVDDEAERRGIERVLQHERALGRMPVEASVSDCGFNITSTAGRGEIYTIAVKTRVNGADDFLVTHNEVVVSLNAAPQYRLALVQLDARGAEFDEVRYLDAPFPANDLDGFERSGITSDWSRAWARGTAPF